MDVHLPVAKELWPRSFETKPSIPMRQRNLPVALWRCVITLPLVYFFGSSVQMIIRLLWVRFVARRSLGDGVIDGGGAS